MSIRAAFAGGSPSSRTPSASTSLTTWMLMVTGASVTVRTVSLTPFTVAIAWTRYAPTACAVCVLNVALKLPSLTGAVTLQPLVTATLQTGDPVLSVASSSRLIETTVSVAGNPLPDTENGVQPAETDDGVTVTVGAATSKVRVADVPTLPARSSCSVCAVQVPLGRIAAVPYTGGAVEVAGVRVSRGVPVALVPA